MYITPDSTIHVLKNIPVNKSNTIWFANASSQYSYFYSKRKHTFNGCTYVRDVDGKYINKIRLGKKADDFHDCNYIMYRNTSFSNKWFYGYIVGIEYINNQACEITIEMDDMQTWFFDFTLKTSFVEREHVTSDNIGEHILDEGLEHGEYVYKKYQKTGLMDEICYVIGISDITPISEVPANPRVYDNIYGGLVFWVFREDSLGAMTDFLKMFESKPEAIEFIFTIPYCFVQQTGQLMNFAYSKTVTYRFETNMDNINGYVPNNNKLFVYPYNVLTVSNNQGNIATYRFEDFTDASIENYKFILESNLAPNPVVMCMPSNYRYNSLGRAIPEFGLSMSGYPLCSWNNDVYRNWLVQNSASLLLGTVGGLGAVLGGIATANPIAIGGGAMAIGRQLSQVHKASLQPDQAKGNTNSGSLNIAHGRQDFYFIHQTIKKEYAKIIDKYFDMFGYKVNLLKVPNINARRNWTYVKTIDVNMVGSCPSDSLEAIKSMFNNGITFWKYGDNVGNYSLDNKL